MLDLKRLTVNQFSMRKQYFFLVLMLIFCACIDDTYAQLNKYGIPVIRNYNSQVTGGSELNWWITKDKFGSVYFANDEQGVIKYNGSTWSSIPIRNNARVRALECDEDGIIYVGGAFEFGYIAPDIQGKPIYVSLSKKLEAGDSGEDQDKMDAENDTVGSKPVIEIGEIQSVATIDSLVFFLNPTNTLFIYNRLTGGLHYINIKELGFTRFERVFRIFDRIFLADGLKGVCEYSDGEIILLPGGDFFYGMTIITILPYEEGKILIGTHREGIMLYDYITGTVNSNWVETSARSRLNQIYCGAKLPGDYYAFGTINGLTGILVLDREGKLTSIWNTGSTEMQDNIIYAMYSGQDNSELWVSTTGTITKFSVNLPYTRFSTVNGIDGGANGICSMDGTIYIGTDIGVKRSRVDDNGIRYFEAVEEISDQVFPVVKADVGREKFLVAGTYFDSYMIKSDGSVSEIVDIGLGFPARSILQSSLDPKIFYFGAPANSFSVLEYSGGTWRFIRKVGNIVGSLTSQVELDNGDLIVLAQPPSMLYKIRLNDSLATSYTSDNGLTEASIWSVGKIGDNIVISTSNGILKYIEDKDSWVTFNEITGGYSAGKYVNFLFEDEDHDLWMDDINEERHTAVMVEKSDSQIIQHKNKLLALPKVAISGAMTIEGRTWLTMSKNVFVINKEMLKLPDVKPQTLLTRIMIGADSTLMAGSFYKTNDIGIRIPQATSVGNEIPEIKFNLNSLSFYWTTPYFIDEDYTQYSYKLEGFSDEWSRWDDISYKEFTNLSFGKYTFRVKARAINGIESTEAVFEFLILKPWYLKSYMIILYIIAMVFIILGIVRAYTRKLKNENIRLEGIVAERTAVVVKQKEELESSIHYARRIQMALLPSENILSENLSNYFILFKPRDIVSGDFYWMTKKDNRLYIVAADCTGHGVPGAFMSLLGMSFLDEIIDKETSPRADIILSELRLHVTESLKQSGGDDEAKDGMDLALLVIDFNSSRVEFSGAYNPCFRIRKLTDEEKKQHLQENMEMPDGTMTDGKYLLETIYASKMPIGISSRMSENFVFNDWELDKGVSYYLFSDGYIDQFGGTHSKKFMKKNFKRLLLEIQEYPMKKQKEVLDQNLKDWMGESPQIDDILVMGIRTD